MLDSDSSSSRFTRRYASQRVLATNPAAREMLDALVRGRLVNSDRGDDQGGVVSVAHEALLSHWPRLRQWLTGEEEFLRARARVGAAAARWLEEGRSADFLLPEGRAFAEAEELLAARRADLAPNEIALIDASARSLSRRTLRRRLLAWGVVASLAAITLVASWGAHRAFLGRDATLRQTRVTQRVLAQADFQEAERLFDEDHGGEALANLARAIREDQTNRPAATRLLAALMQRTWPERVGGPFATLGSVERECFSRDGSHLFFVDREGKLERLALHPPAAKPEAVATAAKLQRATLTPDRALILALAADGRRIELLESDSLNSRATLPLAEPLAQWFPSRDGRWLLTTGAGGDAAIWNLREGKLQATLPHPQAAQHACWHPRGASVATVGGDGKVRVWSSEKGALLFEAGAHAGPAALCQFSPAGDLLALAPREDVLALIDAEKGGAPRAEFPCAAKLRLAAFSPNGQTVATAGEDRQVRIWAFREKVEQRTAPFAHPAEIFELTFSPDSDRLATTSRDGTRLWIARKLVNTVHPQMMLPAPLALRFWTRHAVFSRSGRDLLTSSAAGEARIWDAPADDWGLDKLPDGWKRGQPLTEPFRHGDGELQAFFTPDETQAVTVTGSELCVWDVRLRESCGARLPDPGVATFALAPDSRGVATALEDEKLEFGRWSEWLFKGEGNMARRDFGGTFTIALHDFANGARRWTGPRCESVSLPLLGFDPRGRALAVVDDRLLRVLDAGNGAMRASVESAGTPREIVWSADGQRLATVSQRVRDHSSSTQIHVRAAADLAEVSRFDCPAPWLASALSADGTILLVALTETAKSNGKVAARIEVLDAPTAHPRRAAISLKDPPSWVGFNRDGTVAVAVTDGRGQAWTLADGKTAAWPAELAPSADSSFVRSDGRVSVRVDGPTGQGRDNTGSYLQFFDPASGHELARPQGALRAVFRTGQGDVAVKLNSSDIRPSRGTATDPIFRAINESIFSLGLNSGEQRVILETIEGPWRLADPFFHDRRVRQMAITPDERWLALSSNGRLRTIELPFAESPAPAWLADLSEAASGFRAGPQGVEAHGESTARLAALRQKFAQTPPRDACAAVGRWFLGDPASRSISPHSTVSQARWFAETIDPLPALNWWSARYEPHRAEHFRRGDPTALGWMAAAFSEYYSDFLLAEATAARPLPLPHAVLCLQRAAQRAQQDEYNQPPVWTAAIRQDLAQALEILDGLPALPPADRDALWRKIAVLLRTPAEARALCARALAATPGAAFWHAAQGNALFEEGATAAALASLRRAAELEPASEFRWREYGWMLLAADQPAEAAAAFSSAARLRPADDPGILQELALASWRAVQPARAAEHLERWLMESGSDVASPQLWAEPHSAGDKKINLASQWWSEAVTGILHFARDQKPRPTWYRPARR